MIVVLKMLVQEALQFPRMQQLAYPIDTVKTLWYDEA